MAHYHTLLGDLLEGDSCKTLLWDAVGPSWGCIKNLVSFEMTKSRCRFFLFTLIVFSGGELPVDKKCDFSAFCGCESILGRKSTDVIFCFHFLSSPFILHSFCIHVLSRSFHFALMSFHFAFMSFHIPSLCIKDTGLRKLICSNRSGGYPHKHPCFFFIFCYRFCYRLAIVWEAYAGCHLQVS